MNDEPSLYSKIHWRVFNFLGKSFGVLMSIWAIIFAVGIIVSASGPNRYGFTIIGTVLAIVACLFMFVLGLAVFKSEPYYPEEHRDYFKKKNNSKIE